MILTVRADKRGELAEFIKQEGFGQVFVTRTRPGYTRGNHFHRHKIEKFLVVEGECIFRIRTKDARPVEYHVSGKDFRVITVFPFTAHSFENIGETDLVVIVWANEIFDPENPDTYTEE